MAKPAFSTFAVRTLSGAVLFVLVVGATLLSPYSFAALLLVICIGAVHEFYDLAGKAGAEPQRMAGVTTAALIVAANFLLASGFGGMPMGVVLACAFVLFFALFAAELYRKRERPLLNIAATITGIVYVAFPLSMMCYLAVFPFGEQISAGGCSGGLLHTGARIEAYKPWLILCYIFLVWLNDIGAYVFGVAFGRHRLFERISPKKSWEGLFGGLLVAIGGGILMGWLLTGSGGDARINMAFWGGLGAVTVVSGVMGDLVESMFKRSVGVKDSGNIMPGHGGMLDRFDAMLYSAPFVFLYFYIFAA